MFGETSRVAALVGCVGLIIGAIAGTGVDNYLKRDRDLERDVFKLQLEGIRTFLGGKTGYLIDQYGQASTNPEKDSYAQINYGRHLIAISGQPELVKAIQRWMKQETNVPSCNQDDQSLKAYLAMRRALVAPKWGLFGRGGTEDLPPQMVGEVAARCLFKK